MISTVMSAPAQARRALRAALCAVLLGLSLSACYRPPVGLSDCFESLPLAEGVLNAAKGAYSFKGVKLVSPKMMERLVKRRYPHLAPPSLNVPRSTDVCAFAFTGSFKAGQVAYAPPQATGRAAIVLTTTGRQVLFSFVLVDLPERFGRTFTAVP